MVKTRPSSQDSAPNYQAEPISDEVLTRGFLLDLGASGRSPKTLFIYGDSVKPIMASERVQRRIDRLLDQAEEAMDRLDWESVRDVAKGILGLDPENRDALAFLASAEQVLEPESAVAPARATTSTPTPPPAQTMSFANGRYQVKRFLGEGGKKKVYLAQDTTLDREVAFALIKTEGLDETSVPVSSVKPKPWAGWVPTRTS